MTVPLFYNWKGKTMNSDIITTVSEYSAWTETTAVYPRDDSKREYQYILLGFISEIGEVCGMLKRELRDPDYTLERLNLKLELGDIAWYLARLHYKHTQEPDGDEDSTIEKIIKYLDLHPENMNCFETARAIWEHLRETAQSRSKAIEFLIGKNLGSLESFHELAEILERKKENLSPEEIIAGTTVIAMTEMYSMPVPKLLAHLIEHCHGTLGIIGFFILCDRFRFNPLDVMRANFTKLEDKRQHELQKSQTKR